MSNCKHCGHCVAGCNYCSCCGKCERCGRLRPAGGVFAPVQPYAPYPWPYTVPVTQPIPVTEPTWLPIEITCSDLVFRSTPPFSPSPETLYEFAQTVAVP